MKANYLTRALDQWSEDKETYRLWYNSNHVIALEGEYEGTDLTAFKSYPCARYEGLDKFGFLHFLTSFDLSPNYQRLLMQYLHQDDSWQKDTK